MQEGMGTDDILPVQKRVEPATQTGKEINDEGGRYVNGTIDRRTVGDRARHLHSQRLGAE
jgi:hypothetical protein